MATSIFRQNFPGAQALQQAADTADFLVGLDLHKQTTAVCVLDRRRPEEPVFQRKRLKNGDLLATLQRFSGRKVVVCEAAYGWFRLRDALAELPDVTLVLLDARKTASWIATSGIKNDGIDAQVLCYVCLHGGIPSLVIHQSGRGARECCKLIQHRHHLVRQRIRIVNQLHAIECDYGVNPFMGELPERSALVTAMEADLRAAFGHVEGRIREMDRQIALLSKDDAVIALLRSIPGVGPLTAFALRHKIETIDRFADQSHLSSYFGFGVRQWQSGNRLTKGKITKTGNTLIRSLLVQGTQTVRRSRPEYLPLYFPNLGQQRLMGDSHHANKVVIALARKHLTFAYVVWKNRTPFDIERYRQRRLQADAAVSGAISSGESPSTSLPSPVSSKQAADLVARFAR